MMHADPETSGDVVIEARVGDKITVSANGERTTVQLVTIPPAGPLGQPDLLAITGGTVTPFERAMLQLVESMAWNAEMTRVAVEQLGADVAALRKAWRV